jgi:hypothetical protein
MLAFLGQLARIGTALVLLAVTAGVAWLGWAAGSAGRAGSSSDDPARAAADGRP